MVAYLKKDGLILLGILIIGVVIGALGMAKGPEQAKKVFNADEEQFQWKDEVIATGLDIPWDLAEEPSGRILFTERTGKVKALNQDGTIKTLAEIPVAIVSESGLTGIALHPDYEKNHYLYLYYTYRSGGELLNKVARYTLVDDQLKEDKVLFDRFPGGQIHNGGRIRFGPDQKLYIETGDAARPALAQDLNSLSGKILRVNDDGSVPADNPIKDSPIYTYGHRNPQGLDWHPLTEQLFATEHGDTAHDELNIIQAGKNYGWPNDRLGNGQADPTIVQPILESGSETWAPSGLAFYGSSIWGLHNTAFMAGLRSQQLMKLEIVDGKVADQEILLKGKYGRLRAVYVKKDGTILITTSNRDGRNTPAADDDRIIKLTVVRENQ